MFTDPEYREEVTQELYLFKAKLLAVIGQMNARGVAKPTSDMMEKTLGVYRGIMEAWVAGDMFEIEIHRFDMGVFRKETTLSEAEQHFQDDKKRFLDNPEL